MCLYWFMALASAQGDTILVVILSVCLSLAFGVPCHLHSLIDLRKLVGLSFVQLTSFLVMAFRVFTCQKECELEGTSSW